MTEKQRILVIDDEEFNLKLLAGDLEDAGYEVVKAEDGKIAIEILKNDSNFEVILLDRMMPNMDGIATLKFIKQNDETKNIPVIMQTAAASSKQIQEGIESGVFYYLTKPYQLNILLAIIKSAINHSLKTKKDFDKANSIYQTYNLIESGRFRFRTIKDTTSLSYLISNFCYNPAEALVGIFELMVNAIEHGNLGINCSEKTQLLYSNQWIEEIDKRLGHKEFIDKEAQLYFERKKDFIEITIEDMGKGFDWHPYMAMESARATLPNGRGIAIAKLISFNSIDYIGKGNVVVCRILAKPSTKNKFSLLDTHQSIIEN